MVRTISRLREAWAWHSGSAGHSTTTATHHHQQHLNQRVAATHAGLRLIPVGQTVQKSLQIRGDSRHARRATTYPRKSTTAWVNRESRGFWDRLRSWTRCRLDSPWHVWHTHRRLLLDGAERLLLATYLRAALSHLLLGLPLLLLLLRLDPLLLLGLVPLLLLRLTPLLLLGLTPLLLLRLLLLFAKVGHWLPKYTARHRATSAVDHPPGRTTVRLPHTGWLGLLHRRRGLESAACTLGYAATLIEVRGCPLLLGLLLLTLLTLLEFVITSVTGVNNSSTWPRNSYLVLTVIRWWRGRLLRHGSWMTRTHGLKRLPLSGKRVSGIARKAARHTGAGGNWRPYRRSLRARRYRGRVWVVHCRLAGKRATGSAWYGRRDPTGLRWISRDLWETLSGKLWILASPPIRAGNRHTPLTILQHLLGLLHVLYGSIRNTGVMRRIRSKGILGVVY